MEKLSQIDPEKEKDITISARLFRAFVYASLTLKEVVDNHKDYSDLEIYDQLLNALVRVEKAGGI